MYSHEKNENVFIGALRFKGGKLILDPHLGSFIEVYGPRRPPSAIPKLTVTFGNLTINGKRVARFNADASYEEGVPDYAQAKARGKTVVVKLGKHVGNRKQRRVRLISS